jgi:hypothetical protein
MQIISLLKGLRDLRLPIPLNSKELKLSDKVVSDYLKSCRVGQLFQLFKPLCDLSRVVSGSQYHDMTHGNGSSGCDETIIADLVNDCICILGEFMM